MKTLLAFAALIGCTVAANLLMKTGASTHAPGSDFLSKLTSWQVLVALSCLAAAAVVYVWILSWMPLNVAQSFAAVQFIAVILAARVYLSEPIGDLRWAGIVLISIGIGVVGWSR